MLELKHEKKEKRKRFVAAARAARLLSDNMVWLIRSPEVNEDMGFLQYLFASSMIAAAEMIKFHPIRGKRRMIHRQ